MKAKQLFLGVALFSALTPAASVFAADKDKTVEDAKSEWVALAREAEVTDVARLMLKGAAVVAAGVVAYRATNKACDYLGDLISQSS